MLLLSKKEKEKEKRVIELANQGKTTREIAKAVHISFKDIGKIIRKVTGDEDLTEEEKEGEEDKTAFANILCNSISGNLTMLKVSKSIKLIILCWFIPSKH